MHRFVSLSKTENGQPQLFAGGKPADELVFCSFGGLNFSKTDSMNVFLSALIILRFFDYIGPFKWPGNLIEATGNI